MVGKTHKRPCKSAHKHRNDGVEEQQRLFKSQFLSGVKSSEEWYLILGDKRRDCDVSLVRWGNIPRRGQACWCNLLQHYTEKNICKPFCFKLTFKTLAGMSLILFSSQNAWPQLGFSKVCILIVWNYGLGLDSQSPTVCSKSFWNHFKCLFTSIYLCLVSLLFYSDTAKGNKYKTWTYLVSSEVFLRIFSMSVQKTLSLLYPYWDIQCSRSCKSTVTWHWPYCHMPVTEPASPRKRQLSWFQTIPMVFTATLS